MQPTDQELVRTVLEGPDPEAHRAFEAIVDRWKDPVYRFLRSRIRHDADAEDAAADTFVEAWRSLPGLREPERFGSWLLRIAWTRAVRWYEGRGMRAELTLVEQALLDERVAFAPIPIQDDLRDALSEMPADQLGLLLDKYETKMTYQEIANRDGIAVSTVRDRLVEARDRMARILQRRGLLEEFAEEIERRRRQRREGRGPDAGPTGPDRG